jgi:hypothetical protein
VHRCICNAENIPQSTRYFTFCHFPFPLSFAASNWCGRLFWALNGRVRGEENFEWARDIGIDD